MASSDTEIKFAEQKMNEQIKKYEKDQIKTILKKSKVTDFNPGDTVKVNLWIKEGDKQRVQAFQGVCIAKKSNGLSSSFTVRKISSGEGVERVFPLYSNLIESIERVKTGSVRRAKLYYLRDLSGKKARIAERKSGRAYSDDQYLIEEEPEAQNTIVDDKESNEANTENEAQANDSKAEENTNSPVDDDQPNNTEAVAEEKTKDQSTSDDSNK